MGRKTSDNYENDMTEEKEAKFISWVKNHKKELLIGTGIVVLAPIAVAGVVIAVGAMAGSKNGLETAESDMFNDIGFHNDNVVSFSDTKKAGSPKAPHTVDAFVRNLHKGWNASPEKVAEAAEKGIVLGKNQTYVNSYKTGTVD